MGEYFNEEDLINDYINDVDEEEPPFDYEEYGMDPPEETEVKKKGNNDAAGAAGLGDGDANNANDNDNDNRGLSSNDNADMGNDAANANQSASATNEEGESVPCLINTSPTKLGGSANADLYGFERYSGLGGWRSNKSHGANSNKDGEKGGATTMEATGWKKKQDNNDSTNDNVKKKNDRDEFDMSDDDSFDNDDLDNAKFQRKRSDPNNTSTGNSGSYGASNKGGEAQLVRFRELEARVILGRSWGRNRNTHDIDDHDGVGCVVAAKSMPTLGEASVSITLADGTRTFVRKTGKRSLMEATTTTNDGENTNNDNTNNNDAGDGPKDKEECLLGLPMTEVVRRADILQKRAIRRKLENEERRNMSRSKEEQSNTMEEYSNQNNDEAMEDAQEEQTEKSRTNAKQQKDIKNDLQKKRQHKQLQLQNALWVDKHAPTSISHLLSDERTNREVLRSLREWDPYVFKREAPVRPAPAYPSWQDQQTNNNNGGDNNKNKYQKGKKDQNDNNKDGSAEGNGRVDVRPEETNRVILLSGPPGVGKTTLAHIVAKHAGYRPIEVNASDERSASALTERVTRAMESSTLILETNEETGTKSIGGNRKGGKPNCIILDEVDGADAKASIAALVDIIRADIPPPGASSKGGKKGGSGAPYLRRPIILICNHKYAPALRPILPYAKQFDVNPPNPERLTSRLRAVLSAERMSVVAGGMLLHRLVGSSGGDVRSCLYALQFASARAREVALKKLQQQGVAGDNEEDASNIVVDISSTLMAALGDGGNGMKDMRSDVSSTVATVFRKGKLTRQNKRQKTSNASSTAKKAAAALASGVNQVLSSVDRFGDNSKTLDALFLNVNRVSYIDPTLDRTSSAFEWLSGADTYRCHRSNVAMNNGAEFFSMQKYYIPAAAGAVHLLCRVETRPDLTFSTRPLGDLHYQNQANESLVRRFVEGLSTRARRGAGGAGVETVVEDVIPYGLWLLSAGDGKGSLSRPVSSVDVMTDEERVAFGSHVETLRALGLTYVKDENNAGGFDRDHFNNAENSVRLEPEIDKLVKFENMNGGNDDAGDGGRKNIPSHLKELLAHGATVAALRERESEARLAQKEAAAAREKSKVNNEKQKKPQAAVVQEAAVPKEMAKKPTPSKSITPKKQPIKAKAGSNTSAAKNFLGFRAAKAKEGKAVRRAARVGFDRSSKTKVKFSNTGSGVDISKVIRFKYQKGFTQAVRAPCQLEDLL